jgi:hypothetical protein
MSDTPQPAPAPQGAADSVARYIEKFGLPTAILCVVGYVGYGEIIRPITAKYIELVEEVKNSNKTLASVTEELRLNIKSIAEANGGKIDRIEDRLKDIDSCVKRLERLIPAGRPEPRPALPPEEI